MSYLIDLQTPGFPIVRVLTQPSGWNSSDFAGAIEGTAVTGSIGTGTNTPDLALIPFDNTLPVVTSQQGDSCDSAVAYDAISLQPFAAFRGWRNATTWDLSTGSLVDTLPVAVNCPSYPYTDSIALGCSDAIAMSGSRVVAIGNYMYPQRAPSSPAIEQRFAVTIGKLSGNSVSWPVRHQFPACSVQFGSDLAHDVAISPDGLRSVVGGPYLLAIFKNRDGTLIDLQKNVTLPVPRFVVEPSERQTTDSVEISNHRAVFAGNAIAFSDLPIAAGAADNDTFRVVVADLDVNPPAYSLYDPNSVGLSPSIPSRVHDLSITPNGWWAAVSTRAGLLILDLRMPASDPPPTPVFLSSAPDPLAFGMNISAPGTVIGTRSLVFCSDSVETTNTVAVVIGRDRQTLPNGQIFIADLATSAATAFSLGPDHVPTDISITPDGTKVVVRSIHKTASDPAASPLSPSRITVLSLPSGALLMDETSAPQTPSWIGHAFGRDQVETSNHFAITAGEDFPASLGTANDGWIQVVELQ